MVSMSLYPYIHNDSSSHRTNPTWCWHGDDEDRVLAALSLLRPPQPGEAAVTPALPRLTQGQVLSARHHRPVFLLQPLPGPDYGGGGRVDGVAVQVNPLTRCDWVVRHSNQLQRMEHLCGRGRWRVEDGQNLETDGAGLEKFCWCSCLGIIESPSYVSRHAAIFGKIDLNIYIFLIRLEWI